MSFIDKVTNKATTATQKAAENKVIQNATNIGSNFGWRNVGLIAVAGLGAARATNEASDFAEGFRRYRQEDSNQMRHNRRMHDKYENSWGESVGAVIGTGGGSLLGWKMGGWKGAIIGGAAGAVIGGTVGNYRDFQSQRALSTLTNAYRDNTFGDSDVEGRRHGYESSGRAYGVGIGGLVAGGATMAGILMGKMKSPATSRLASVGLQSTKWGAIVAGTAGGITIGTMMDMQRNNTDSSRNRIQGLGH